MTKMFLDISGLDRARIKWDVLRQGIDKDIDRALKRLTASFLDEAIPSMLNQLAEMEARRLSGKIRLYRCDIDADMKYVRYDESH